MLFDIRQVVAAFLTLGMFVALLDMMISGSYSPTMTTTTTTREEITVSIVSAGGENVEEHLAKSTKVITVQEETPKALWGLPGPLLKPCWSKHIKDVEAKTHGYVLVKLSNGPLYHPMQVADAVIIARSIGATLVLPKIKEATKEPNGAFDKIYDVTHFLSSLRDVVPIVTRLPRDARSVTPTVVKVPYKVSLEYIEDEVQPLILGEKPVILITTIFSLPSMTVRDSPTEEMQAIRCLVMYNALKFHPRVQELGEQVMSQLRESSGSNRFIAVDLRVDMLQHKGCRQPKNAKSKKCFDASDVGTFLKSLGFSSTTPIYLTQSSWEQSLDPLKEFFSNLYTKEHVLPSEEGHNQFGRAIDMYICTHSDVFVPAISGVSYVNIAGTRIATGKTQILVPTTVSDEDDTSSLEVSRVLSRFVSKKDHGVYSCFCKAPNLLTSKSKKKKVVD